MTSSLPTTKLLAACGTLLALAGCGGCYKSPDERRLLLTITQPTQGAVLTEADKAADDLDAGVRADVRLQLEWESLTSGKREAAAFGSAGLELRRTDLDGGTFAKAAAGAAQFSDGGVALIPGVDFAENGSYELRATAAAVDSDLVPEPVTVALKVEVLEHRPVLDSVTFPQDVNTDGTLNAAELAQGSLLQLAVAGHDALGGSITIASEDGGTVYVDGEPFPADGGTWAVDVGADPLEQALSFRVTLKDEQGRPSLDPVLLPSIYVDQVAPVVALLSPTDGGYTTHALQGQAQVTGAPEGTLVQFVSTFVDGGTWDAGVYATDDGGVAAGELLFNDGEQVLVARAADVAGNFGESAGVPLVITANSCNVTLTQPSGAVFAGPEANVADGGTDYVMVVAGTSNCPNQAVTVKVDDTSVATGTTDANGNFSLQVPVAPGSTRALVVDVNGSTTLPTTVLTSKTAFALTSPVNGDVLSLVNDADAQAAGVQASFGYSPAAGSFTVTACSTLGSGPSATACPDGASGWFVMATGVAAANAAFSYPDGNYQVKAVMLSGSTVLATTAPAALTVDGTRPAVSAIALQGDTNADLKLNLSEQAAGDVVVLVTPSGLEVGQAVFIYKRGTSTQLGQAAVTAVGAPLAVTLTGTPGTADELDLSLEVRMTDAAGNASDPALASAQADIRVDRLAPTCALTAPTRAAVGVADDADAAAGFQLAMAASTSSDTASLQLRANALTGAAAVNGTLATGNVTLPSTGTVAYVLGCTATDGAGNVGNEATGNVTVDLDVPAPVITAPAAGPLNSFVLTTTVSVPGEADGLSVNVFSTPTGGAKTQVGTLTLSGGVATGNVTYPTLGAQQLTAEVTDAAGNLGTSAPVQVNQQSQGCSIALTAPAGVAQFQNASDGTVAGSTLKVTVAGASGNCKSTGVKLYSGTGPGRTEVASGTTDAVTGAFSLQSNALAEGAQHLEVEMVDALTNTTTVPWDFTVDVTPPGASGVTPGEAALSVVAPANSHLWDSVNGTFWAADGGYYADSSAGTSGGQLAVSVTATGAQGGKVEVYFDGGLVAGPADVTADPGAVALTATLPQGSAGLDVQVKDAAGNIFHALGASGTPTVVDVVAPAAPAPQLTLLSQRSSSVSATWSAVFDDGSSNTSGAVAGYDVRWTTDAIAPALTEASYFDGTKFKQHTGALVTGTTTTLAVPPLATYSVEVRAVDDVGNYSTFAAPASLANGWTESTLALTGASGDTSSTTAGVPLAVGDVAGDGANDIIVGADTAATGGAVFIYEGVLDGGVPTNVVQLEAPSPVSGDAFGFRVATGNFLGTGLPGDTQQDLLVAAPFAGGNFQGKVFLYAGPVTATSTPDYVITGSDTQTLGVSDVSIIPDINGDGRAEIVVADPFATTDLNFVEFPGAYYIFFGRAPTGGAAQALALGAADRVIGGPQTSGGTCSSNGQCASNVCKNLGGGCSNDSECASGACDLGSGTCKGTCEGMFACFGYNWAVTSLGDINGGGADFTLGASSARLNNVYVVSGGAVGSGGAAQSIADPSVLQTLNVTLAGGEANDPGGLGASAVGGVDFVGGSGLDLAVGTTTGNEVRLFSDGTGSGFTTSVGLRRLLTNAGFGGALAAGDLDGDGRADLVVGEATAAARGLWAFFAGGAFTELQDVPGEGQKVVVGSGFFQAHLAPSGQLGSRVRVADVNGDGLPDIVSVGYDTGNNTARVHVWH